MSDSAGTNQGNIGTGTGDHDTLVIILAGFGIIGSLAGIFIFHPEEAAKDIVLAVVSGIVGFIAGRKKI